MFLTLVIRVARIAALGIIFLLMVFLPRRLVERRYLPHIYSVDAAPSSGVAIVFGAGLRRDGRPTAVLSDRVRAASELYRQGKVGQLLMSGTRRGDGYDEPQAMRELALELQVPEHAILTDGEGTRTLLTCLRAKEVFGFRQALLVSQSYHLPRALATCAGLGIDAEGVSADLRTYSPRAQQFWQAREVPATLVALWETRLAPVVSGTWDWLSEKLG